MVIGPSHLPPQQNVQFFHGFVVLEQFELKLGQFRFDQNVNRDVLTNLFRQRHVARHHGGIHQIDEMPFVKIMIIRSSLQIFEHVKGKFSQSETFAPVVGSEKLIDIQGRRTSFFSS